MIVKYTSLALAVIVAGLMAGCAEDGGAGREGSPVWFMRTSAAEQAAYFQSVCVSYGFKPNTPEMAQCMQTEALNARNSASSRMQAVSNSYQTTRTNCTGFGNTLNCTSSRW